MTVPRADPRPSPRVSTRGTRPGVNLTRSTGSTARFRTHAHTLGPARAAPMRTMAARTDDSGVGIDPGALTPMLPLPHAIQCF
eukprot:3240993-Prymnesium_polylepis.1